MKDGQRSQTTPKGYRPVDYLIILAILLIIAAILYPVRAYSGPGFSGSNMQSIWSSAMMYSLDNDDRLPLTRNWPSALRSGPKNSLVKVSNERKTIPEARNMMNTYASGRKVSTQEEPEYIPLFFVGQAGHGNAGTVDHLYEFKERIYLVTLNGDLRVGKKPEAYKLKWIPSQPAPQAANCNLSKREPRSRPKNLKS